ncbi:hypothetical protein ACFV4M_22300 [Kitasatospora indigofera]|uniref:hypothetical protein n=1 Tax=Kitasatospora indigofera TaxID=67307 RepID=UPI0036484404
MSVLLGGLGDALSRTSQVARVLTLVGAGSEDVDRGLPLVARRGPEHWVIGIPVDTRNPLDSRTAAVHGAALAWWATRLLAVSGAAADMVHARFADDASLAMADAARRSGARFAFTVTPDPHRHTARRHGGLPDRSQSEQAEALRLDLHRIFVADALVDRADLLVTILGARAPPSCPSPSRSWHRSAATGHSPPRRRASRRSNPPPTRSCSRPG